MGVPKNGIRQICLWTIHFSFRTRKTFCGGALLLWYAALQRKPWANCEDTMFAVRRALWTLRARCVLCAMSIVQRPRHTVCGGADYKAQWCATIMTPWGSGIHI